MSKDDKAANKGGTYYLRAEDKAPFDDSKFQPGDEVAAIMVSKFTGDRGDIDAAIAWKDGVWTAVLSRKLITGSKFDVQFDKLATQSTPSGSRRSTTRRCGMRSTPERRS